MMNLSLTVLQPNRDKHWLSATLSCCRSCQDPAVAELHSTMQLAGPTNTDASMHTVFAQALKQRAEWPPMPSGIFSKHALLQARPAAAEQVGYACPR